MCRDQIPYFKDSFVSKQTFASSCDPFINSHKLAYWWNFCFTL